MEAGERDKIVICVAGMTGCGKSTVAKRLARRYGLRYFSGGNALKAMASEIGYKPYELGWWETEEGMSFLRKRTQNPKFDLNVDKQLVEEAKRGNVVLDSWTMPWLLKEGFKIWLDASIAVRAKRTAKRNKITFEEALNLLKEKDVKTKALYSALYSFDLGKDLSPFDLILDTNKLEADEVFSAIYMVTDCFLIKQN